MSVVTNALLRMPLAHEEEEIAKLVEVNLFFAGSQAGFVSLDDPKLPIGWYGGSKMLEVNLAVGAFNYLSLDELCAHIREITWAHPDEVQLIVQEQDDDVFRIIHPCKERERSTR